jgi:hypothetical protein
MRTAFGSRRRTKGQAALLMTLTLTMMLAAMGLVVDFGWAYWRKEAAATAANSAAIAAIVAANSVSNQFCGSGTDHWKCSSAAYSCPASPSTGSIASNFDNGCLYAAVNGFNNTGRQSVTMVSGTGAPPAAPGVSPSYWVTVTVTEGIPTFFSAVIGQRWMNVAAQSTAAIFSGTAGGCIFVLDPTDSGSLTMNGNASLVSQCGVYVNSSDAGAISMVGTSSITTHGHAKTWVVGGVSSTPNATITPSAVTGAAVTPDPYAGQMPVAPAVGGCQPTAEFTGSGTNTIPAGTYCDEVSQGGSGTLTLSSGTYVLKAGISLKGSASLTTTGPVTLYIAGGGIDLVGNTGVNLSAPTSGAYQGIAIWQPSSNTTAGVIHGGATQAINGLIYMPKAGLTYTGNSAISTTSFVVYTLTMVGTTSINNPSSTPWAGLGANGTYFVQ